MQDTPQNRYRKKNLWTLSTTFNRATEPQLIEQVKRQDNKQGYIKALIRADIAKAKNKEGETMVPDYNKIAREGGIYDTKKYRYAIDTSTGDIKRIPLNKLDTVSARDSWTVVRRYQDGKKEG